MPKQATGKHAKTITIDTVMVQGFEVNTFPAGQEALAIKYLLGSTDKEGNFTPVEQKRKIIQGDDFNAIAASTPDTSGGLFAALQDILYDEIDKEA